MPSRPTESKRKINESRRSNLTDQNPSRRTGRSRKPTGNTTEELTTAIKTSSKTMIKSSGTSVQAMDRTAKRLVPDKDDQFAKMVAHMLQMNPWYHGLMPREEIEEMIVNTGDFLVRRTEVGGKTRLAVSVMNKNRIRHILLKISDGKWSLMNLKTGSLTGLIIVHMKTKTPVQSDGTTLINPIPRPDYYILHDHVEVKMKIGGGAFGEVFIGTVRKTDGSVEDCAVKRLKGMMSKKQRAIFMKEAKLMRRFNHPNIVNLLGVAPQEDPVMILLEICPNGALNSMLKKRGREVPCEKLVDYATDAARGMTYLSARKVIHRDIAARNCLIGRKDEVKISDFGLSVADQNIVSVDKLRQMPVRWLAPETLRKGEFSTRTDVWSYGVLLWEIFSRCKSDPYPGMTNAQARQKILSMEIPMSAPIGCPPKIMAVMFMCFTQDAKSRPEFVDLYKILDPVGVPPLADARVDPPAN